MSMITIALFGGACHASREAPQSAAPADAAPDEGSEPKPALRSPAENEPAAEAPKSEPPTRTEEGSGDGVFPPPNPGPPHERSAHEGDGVWRPFFSSEQDAKRDKRVEREVAEDFAREVVVRMVIHPHEASRFQTLTLAAFDTRALEVSHRPGRQDVQDVGRADLEDRAGLVPQEEQARLLAVFNGGFQPRHGRWGMLSLGEQLIPPRSDACTVAITRAGTIVIGPWPELEKRREEIVAYRQTPPCLVEEGSVHSELLRGQRKRWAGQQADRKTRRRSAVGVSADGRTLFYGIGSETEPEVLAAGMAHAGAKYAAQLDINWNWTRLFLFRPMAPGPGIEVVGSLIEDMAKDRGEYVSRQGNRGFFYLLRRQSPSER